MNTNWKTELPQLLLIGAMFGLAAIFWSSVPDRIPMRWGPSGEVIAYGGKFEGLLLEPLMALGLYLLLLFLPWIDPRRANYARFGGVYTVVRIAIILFLAVIQVFTLLWARGVELSANVVISVSAGALFILVGNVMGKIRPNWFFGIRTPWTLSSRRSWVKTHRLGGWVFIFMGIVLVASGFVTPEWTIWATVATVAGGSLLLIAYSYLVWRDDPERGGEAPSGG